MRILAVCPTRDRQELAPELARSFLRTTTFAELVFYVDDDQYQQRYTADFLAAHGVLSQRVKVHVGPRLGAIRSVNSVVEQYPADVYGMIPDDCRFETEGWDRYIEEQVAKLPNGVGVISPHTNFGDQVDMPFATRAWIETLGWFGAPNLAHYCWPTVIATLGYCADPRMVIHSDPKRFHIQHDVRFPIGYNFQHGDAVQMYSFFAQDLPLAIRKLRGAAA